MQSWIDNFYASLDEPIRIRARLLLALLVIPLGFAAKDPLWRYTMEAPQYPNGLYFDVFAHGIESGNGGQHISEINVLNHYIGMHPIVPDEIPELGFMVFALGALGLLTLRVAAIGNVRALVDLSVITLYVLGFFGFRFVYMLYTYGHELDPAAPVTVEPFTPTILGTSQIANFTVHSLPQRGTYEVLVFVLGVVGIATAHVVRARQRALVPRPAIA